MSDNKKSTNVEETVNAVNTTENENNNGQVANAVLTKLYLVGRQKFEKIDQKTGEITKLSVQLQFVGYKSLDNGGCFVGAEFYDLWLTEKTKDDLFRKEVIDVFNNGRYNDPIFVKLSINGDFKRILSIVPFEEAKAISKYL